MGQGIRNSQSDATDLCPAWVTSAAGTTTLSYDYEDRIIGITGPGISNAFGYNAFDARVKKTDSSGTKSDLRDGEDPVDDVLSDGSSTYTPGISSHSAAGSRFEHQDYLGTNRFETDSAQNVTASRTYDAFGNLTSTTGTPQGPFGYAGDWGYQEDADTGLKLLGHRYYDASTGRFLTRDPAHDGTNWFGYCDKGPATCVDPLGFEHIVFNGRLVKLFDDDHKWIMTRVAFSGAPGFQDPRYQTLKNRGPITQGEYYFLPSEIEGKWTGFHPAWWLYPPNQGWGQARVRLYPLSQSAVASNRTNLFFHHTYHNGTAGCIGVPQQGGLDFLLRYHYKNKFVLVTVDYSQWRP